MMMLMLLAHLPLLSYLLLYLLFVRVESIKPVVGCTIRLLLPTEMLLLREPVLSMCIVILRSEVCVAVATLCK